MKWGWLIWLVLLLGSASAQALSSTELEAKRYLHACINAVALWQRPRLTRPLP